VHFVSATPGGDYSDISTNITFYEFDFIIESDDGHFENNVLTDNREATVTISLPESVDTTDISFTLTAIPIETGSLINNNKGTAISFTETENPLIWRASKTYWYGVSPDAECWDDTHEYEFSVKLDGVEYTVLKDYVVSLPDENPGMRPDLPNEDTSETIIHDPEPVPGVGGRYRCLIEFKDFIKEGHLFGLPTTDQYAEETQKEEEFHKKQWLGEVSINLGGQGDLYTGKGIQYMLGWVRTGPWYVYGATPGEASFLAEQTVIEGEELEVEASNNIFDNDRGFIELKAKEHAGYNAAYTYECTYLSTHGANPTNHHHPAY
jgi:hypothetical protein